jgi:serine/threonine protein kinase
LYLLTECTKPEGAPCRVAVKEFKRSQKDAETSDEAQRAFEGEATVLHDLSQLDHPHIVGRIAAIEYGDKYILLSQWADGGDLRKYWSSNPTPKLDERLVRQTLIQLRGLASAIHALHTGDRLNPLSRTATMRDSLPDVPGRPLLPKIVAADDPSQESDIHFRHGDLKPENILVFNIPGSQIGLLKIGDLGLAKRHYAPTVHRRQATSTKYGTLSYEPPEAITMPARPRSRRYDIWSFGCIMFETMIWLLYGHQGLKSFWDLSVDPARGTLFFTTRAAPVGYQAKVNRHTSLLMERMLAQDLTGAGPPGCALRDLLILIQEKVLVVDLPDFSESSSCRIDAGSLLTEMTNIVDKANGRGGADYLLPNILRNSGRPRKIPIAVDSPQPTAALLAVPGAAQRVSALKMMTKPVLVTYSRHFFPGSTSTNHRT